MRFVADTKRDSLATIWAFGLGGRDGCVSALARLYCSDHGVFRFVGGHMAHGVCLGVDVTKRRRKSDTHDVWLPEDSDGKSAIAPRNFLSGLRSGVGTL